MSFRGFILKIFHFFFFKGSGGSVGITISASLSLSGFTLPTIEAGYNAIVSTVEDTISEIASLSLEVGQTLGGVNVLSIAEDLTAEYELILNEVCGTIDCNTIASALYDQVTSAISLEIDNGNFAVSLQAAANANGVDALASVSVTAGDFGRYENDHASYCDPLLSPTFSPLSNPNPFCRRSLI